MGIGFALVASAVTAVVLRTVLLAIPASQDIIEGLTMLVAVGVLFSVSYWLISRVEAAKWQQFIREKVNNALEHGGGRALAFVAFLAVYREGAETALFYQALFNEGAHVVLPITLGILVGFAALAVIFTLFYRFGVRIPLRPFFSVTSVLLYYMAFVFTGTGIRELQEGNAVPITLIRGFPTVEAIGLYPDVGDGDRADAVARAVRVRGREDVLAEALRSAADRRAISSRVADVGRADREAA
jgi:high-affinity iron transporter